MISKRVLNEFKRVLKEFQRSPKWLGWFKSKRFKAVCLTSCRVVCGLIWRSNELERTRIKNWSFGKWKLLQHCAINCFLFKFELSKFQARESVKFIKVIDLLANEFPQ